MTEVVFGPCCFCAKDIGETETDPCSVTVTTANDKRQVWSAHGGCFKRLLTDPDYAPGFFDPMHF